MLQWGNSPEKGTVPRKKGQQARKKGQFLPGEPATARVRPLYKLEKVLEKDRAVDKSRQEELGDRPRYPAGCAGVAPAGVPSGDALRACPRRSGLRALRGCRPAARLVRPFGRRAKSVTGKGGSHAAPFGIAFAPLRRTRRLFGQGDPFGASRFALGLDLAAVVRLERYGRPDGRLRPAAGGVWGEAPPSPENQEQGLASGRLGGGAQRNCGSGEALAVNRPIRGSVTAGKGLDGHL